jgi:hypothetical protein
MDEAAAEIAPLVDLLISATAQVRGRQQPKGRRGSGFFIAPGVLVTCSHVVTAITATAEVEVLWHDNAYACIVQHMFDQEDLAVLIIDGIHVTPVLALPNVQIGDSLFAHGFPDAGAIADSATFVYEGPSFPGPLLKLKAGEARWGMSGSPLLNLRTGGVCAILKRTRGVGTSLGGRAVPIATLFSLLPDIAAKHRRFHAMSDTWLRELADSQRAEVELRSVDEEQDELRRRVRVASDWRLSRFIAGSDRIQLRDIIETPNLLSPFSYRNDTTPTAAGADALTDIVQSIVSSSGADDAPMKQALVLADPGLGKSTLLRLVYNYLARLFQQQTFHQVPIYIDLAEHTQSSSLGTPEWTLAYLREFSHGLRISWQFGAGQAQPAISPIFLLDSLDEYLAGLSQTAAVERLARYLFVNAAVLACRLHFFDRVISFSSFAEGFTKIRLVSWRPAHRDQYVRAYFRALYPAVEAPLFAAAARSYIASPALMDICLVPLHLNMTLDIISDMHAEPAQSTMTVVNRIGLYTEFTSRWLKRESRKRGSALSADAKSVLLQAISWHFYDEGRLGESAARFTRSALDDFIRTTPLLPEGISAAAAIDDIVYRTLLVASTDRLSEQAVLRFAHRSFQEYFVATHISHIMMFDVETTATAFRRHMAAEVSEFLKEYVLDIATNTELLASTVKTFIAAFAANEPADTDDDMMRARKRLAREQLAYYLGSPRSSHAIAFLREQYNKETDPWIRRAIALGLSYCGDPELLSAYLSRLREEEFADSSIERGVNIGFHLSFFGDQPFDVLAPDRDSNQPRCERTVHRLIFQLLSDTNVGSWPLDLYTLVTFGRSPRFRDSFLQAVADHRDDLLRLLEKLRGDERTRHWPDVDALATLIGETDNGTGTA